MSQEQKSSNTSSKSDKKNKKDNDAKCTERNSDNSILPKRNKGQTNLINGPDKSSSSGESKEPKKK